MSVRGDGMAVMAAGPAPLTCADGVCTAEFGAFCMEPDRAGPGHKSPYRLAGTPANGDLRLPVGGQS